MLIIWVGKEMRLGYGLNPKRVFFLFFVYTQVCGICSHVFVYDPTLLKPPNLT